MKAPKTASERYAKMVKIRKEAGIYEVRSIWAHKSKHKEIKDAAKQICADGDIVKYTEIQL